MRKSVELSGFTSLRSDIQIRIERFQKSLRFSEIEAALIVQNADLFNFSGRISRSYLYIPAEKNSSLMVGKNIDRAKADRLGFGSPVLG